MTQPVEPWLCSCGELTLVTHWAWPNGVGVHDPELAYLEAAGLAKQGDGQPPQSGPEVNPDSNS